MSVMSRPNERKDKSEGLKSRPNEYGKPRKFGLHWSKIKVDSPTYDASEGNDMFLQVIEL